MINKLKKEILEEWRKKIRQDLDADGINDWERELENWLSKVLDKYSSAKIEEFCRKKIVLHNFKCGEHGKVMPMPHCPDCWWKDIEEVLKECLSDREENKDVIVQSKEWMKGWCAFRQQILDNFKKLKDGTE